MCRECPMGPRRFPEEATLQVSLKMAAFQKAEKGMHSRRKIRLEQKYKDRRKPTRARERQGLWTGGREEKVKM